MRVAALYDLHGNLPALEAVLEDVRAAGVDAVVVGGDIVPGPLPAACLSALLDLDVPVHFIYGNGERDVLALHRGEALTRVPEAYHGVMRWVANALPDAHFAALAAWPMTRRLEIAGLGTVLFCHATPRDENELFTRRTPEARLRPLFEATGADLVVCGHTHMAFDRMVGAVRVVNAGSVGMPFGAPGAYWLLLGPAVTFRCTDYDLDAAMARIHASGYPQTPPFDLRHLPTEAHMLDVFEAAALR